MISPMDIKEKICTSSSVMNLVERLDAALCEDKNMKDAICGQVTIKIPELFAPFVIIAIKYLYKEAGWKDVYVENFSYTPSLYTVTSSRDSSSSLYGTKFVFQM